eukprot:gene13130-biopygen7990
MPGARARNSQLPIPRKAAWPDPTYTITRSRVTCAQRDQESHKRAIQCLMSSILPIEPTPKRGPALAQLNARKFTCVLLTLPPNYVNFGIIIVPALGVTEHLAAYPTDLLTDNTIVCCCPKRLLAAAKVQCAAHASLRRLPPRRPPLRRRRPRQSARS